MKKNDLSVFEIEKDGFRLKLQKAPAAQTAAATLPAVASPSQTETTISETTPSTPQSVESPLHREIVLFHQIDDGFDFFEIFEFQDALLWFEAKRLGKPGLRARSSQRIKGK